MGAGIVKCIQRFFRDAGQKVPVKEAYGIGSIASMDSTSKNSVSAVGAENVSK